MKKIRFPIRYKFLAVTTMLLVLSVAAYLALASHIFRHDKVELVFDLNRSAVSSIASDVSGLFRGIADKMKLAAVLSQDGRSQAVLNDVLENDSNIEFLAASYGFQRLDRVFYSDKTFERTYSVSDEFFKTELLKSRAIPYAEIQMNGVAIWNATIKDGPPLIGFGKSVVAEVGGGRHGTSLAPFAMIAFVRADKLLQSFSGSRLNEVIAVNRQGQVLVDPTAEKMWSRASYAENPLFKAASTQKMQSGVLSFKYKGEEILGAHALAGEGQIYILSQVDGHQAFSAVESLVRRSLIFASIALTLAFLAAVFFSRSLTRPLQALSEAMEKVAHGGELNADVIEIKTRDEISLLASSFNNMLIDLQTSRSKLEEINRDLEQKVKDRTRRLEEQNQAVKKAQEALLQTTRLATVGEVAGRAAHEVLNPLTSVVARVERVRSRIQRGAVQEVELMKDIVNAWESDFSSGGLDHLVTNWKNASTVDPSVTLWQEDFENVKRSESALREEVELILSDMDFVLKESQRINKIVQNMRALTRTNTEEKIVSIREVLGQAVRIMADLGEHHEIAFIEDYVTLDDRVRLDPDEFTQCATNLFRNSIQAIQARRQATGSKDAGQIAGQIIVSTEIVDHQVVILLTDNGIGIKSDDRSKLFEIQFSTKSAAEGTGLGLTITRRFIRSFGGDIELVRSAPNEGCQFKIVLPLGSASEQQKVAV